jgi:hypothetical protein
MIGLLLWLLGAAGLVYEITARHLWTDVMSAMLGAGLVLWALGGAALLSMRRRGAFPPPRTGALTKQDIERLADLARKQRGEAAEPAK